jgi:DNA-binding response OmpR family regulator
VEDDDQIAAVMRDGLTRIGYRVELAADGPAAMAAGRAQPLDLVILDLLLPGMDGVEVCQRLRAGRAAGDRARGAGCRGREDRAVGRR